MWGFSTVSYHPAKSDGHRYCTSTDITFLDLSQDHVIKSLRDFEVRVFPLQATTLASLVAIGIVKEQI